MHIHFSHSNFKVKKASIVKIFHFFHSNFKVKKASIVKTFHFFHSTFKVKKASIVKIFPKTVYLGRTRRFNTNAKDWSSIE